MTDLAMIAIATFAVVGLAAVWAFYFWLIASRAWHRLDRPYRRWRKGDHVENEHGPT
jgi:O-antigen/teichoic acid export membrane protein